MRPITKIMIKKYALEQIKYDFMGYGFKNIKDLSFHHLIVPHHMCKDEIEGGYIEWNGVILNQDTSHDYLHTIERFDFDRFLAISSEMIEEKSQGYICYQNILYISQILDGFEKEYYGKYNKKGTPIVKESYLRRVLKK